MKPSGALAMALSAAAGAQRAIAATLPVDTVYGVNLGSWFLLEPYMLPDEWSSMGGDSDCSCGDSGCAGSEWDLVNRIGQSQANEVFATHWSTWITQDDVTKMQSLGINVVRIPLGHWIVDAARDPTTDLFPEGGFAYLTQGLGWLADAGIAVLLDMHGVPDQQVASNADTGRCNPNPAFFGNANNNFARAAQAAANWTISAHTLNEWRTVFAIEALNEPPMDASQTPGLDTYYDQFTAAVRGAESDGGWTDNPLTLTFMDYGWQYGDGQINPADHTSGNTFYDNHLYYSFGGVASAQTDEAYFQSICTIAQQRAANDGAQNNSPLVFGEFWLDVESGVDTSGDFYQNWADAQRLNYATYGSGWIFWAWKFEGTVPTRDYQDAVDAGYIPSDPSTYFNSSVCDGYTS